MRGFRREHSKTVTTFWRSRYTDYLEMRQFLPRSATAISGRDLRNRGERCAAPSYLIEGGDKTESGRRVAAEWALNVLIAETAGGVGTIVLDLDFEAVAGLTGHSRQPEREEFRSRPSADMPEPLVRVGEGAISLTRVERRGDRSSVVRRGSCPT
jgi:hypothetical protein